MTRSAQDDSVRYETSHVSRHCKVGVSRISRYVHWGPTVMWLRSRVPRYWPSFTRCVSFYRGSISLSAPPCDARVALDGFVHLRRFASRSRQLAAAQPGCPSLDPHATCSEARPQSLATPQLVSIFSSRCTVWRQDRPSLSAGIGARARGCRECGLAGASRPEPTVWTILLHDARRRGDMQAAVLLCRPPGRLPRILHGGRSSVPP